MKKNSYTFDVVNNTLTLTAAFAGALNNPVSEESKLVRQFKSDFPNLCILRRTRQTPIHYHNSDGSTTVSNKNKKLTYKRMEMFMNSLPDGEKYLDEYNRIRKYAKDMCLAPYALVADWFMTQFPQFRENPLIYVKCSVEVVNFETYIQSREEKTA